MEHAVRKRAGYKGAITTMINKYSAGVIASNDKLGIITLRDNLKANLAKIEVLNDSIYELITDSVRLQQEMVTANEYNLNTLRVVNELEEVLNKLKDPSTDRKDGSEGKHKISLPDIELPKFDGNPANYNKFIVSFESLISKYNLSSFEKFSYLSKQLTGAAKKLVESLSLKDLTYEAAVKLLNEAFSDPLAQQYSVISSLCSLKLNEDAPDAFKWISQARVLKDQIDTLKIDVKTFTQYFLWHSLCDSFKNEVTAITGKSKPSLDEIMDNIFEANNRFIQVQSKKVKEYRTPKSVSLATSVIPSSKTSVSRCTLCFYDKAPNANEHKLSICSKYPDPKSRVERLKAIGGCYKCGSVMHQTKNCAARLNACYKCNRYHMCHLCTVDTKSTAYKEKSSSRTVLHNDSRKPSAEGKSTSNNMITASYPSNVFNDVILPTGTVYVERDGRQLPWRVFKDLGSQTTFVRGSPKDIPNCKIIDKIDLNVKGINSDKFYDSFLVEFPVFVPGQGEQVIKAVCKENIKTKVEVLGLQSVMNHFKNKGYKIADINLDGDIIEDISILLGSDQSHIFPLVQHNFSSEGKIPSAYFDTPSGVMLAGSVSQYLENINCLPIVKKKAI